MRLAFSMIPLVLGSCLLLALLPGIESRVAECKQDEKEAWSYRGRTNGPSAWGETFPSCYGKKQSPIALHSDRAVKLEDLPLITMENYDIPVTKSTLINNGYNLKLVPEDDVVRSITIDGKKYILDHCHCHWGDNWDRGSEHTLDGKQFALEDHWVHKSEDGSLAVVGVFFQESTEHNPYFDPIAEVLDKVQYKGGTAKLLSPVELNGFLPSQPARYFRYEGSLTTPGCDEGVIWTVLKGVQSVSKEQLDGLRNLNSAKENDNNANCRLTDMFRPLQPLNGREVYTTA